jgi:hypothetical protein
MRKHRLYGFVLAPLAVFGVILTRPSGSGVAAADYHGGSANQTLTVQPDSVTQALVGNVTPTIEMLFNREVLIQQEDQAVQAQKFREFLAMRLLYNLETLAAAQSAQRAQQARAAQVVVQTPVVTAATGDVWAELRQCESGGNYAENTGNGYYGAYQFSLGTWQGIGHSGYPSDASAAEQDAAAQELQARSGWGQWPACSRRLGLT